MIEAVLIGTVLLLFKQFVTINYLRGVFILQCSQFESLVSTREILGKQQSFQYRVQGRHWNNPLGYSTINVLCHVLIISRRYKTNLKCFYVMYLFGWGTLF